MKTCTKCGEKKEYNEYGICKRYKDGYRSQCKICYREYNNKWAKENQDKKRVLRKKYRENNRENIRKMDREYYLKNPEKLREQSRRKMKMYLEAKGYEKRAEYKKNFPERIKAQEMIRLEIRTKRMIKPEHCQICSKIGGKIEAHHHDYSKPLEVVWMCSKCHRAIHRIK